jgi:hypothetical protein
MAVCNDYAKWYNEVLSRPDYTPPGGTWLRGELFVDGLSRSTIQCGESFGQWKFRCRLEAGTERVSRCRNRILEMISQGDTCRPC